MYLIKCFKLILLKVHIYIYIYVVVKKRENVSFLTGTIDLIDKSEQEIDKITSLKRDKQFLPS